MLMVNPGAPCASCGVAGMASGVPAPRHGPPSAAPAPPAEMQGGPEVLLGVGVLAEVPADGRQLGQRDQRAGVPRPLGLLAAAPEVVRAAIPELALQHLVDSQLAPTLEHFCESS